MSVDDFIKYELNSQIKIYNKYLKGSSNLKFPTLEQTITTATFGSYTNTSTFSTYLDSLELNFFNIWDSNVREGYLLGIPTKKIVQDVVGVQAGNVKLAEAGAMHTFRNSVMANTRTALQAMANDTRKLVMSNNEELFDGYEWVSTLDRRSCLVCANLGGKKYKRITDFGEQPPIHYNCRCLIVPVISGYDDLNDGDTRASEGKEVSSNMTYEEWLKTQNKLVQLEVLGPVRYKIFKETGSIGDFVNNGEIIPVKELLKQ